MKLHELHNMEILWEGELEGESCVFFVQVEEGVAKAGFGQNTKGGIVTKFAKGALRFVSNPIVAGLAAGYAIDAIKKYKKNKRMTTRFFAKTQQDKRLYKQIVDDLMKTGKYKKKERYEAGGIMWELKRFN